MFPFDRHNTLRKNLTAYADGELSSRDVAAVERHLGACEACRTQLSGLRLATAALKELPALDAPRSFALTRDMLGAAAPRPRAVPAYQTGMRLAVGGLAVALAVVVFADRSDFRGGDQSSDEAQLQELDNRLSETLGVTADSAGGNSDTPLNDSTDELDAGDSPAATSAAGAGLGVGGAERPAEATRVPGDSAVPAADQGADASPRSLPAHGALPDDNDTDTDTKSNENLSAAEGGADTSQDGEREPVGSDGDGSSALTIVEIVLAVLLAATLGGLALAWISQRRKPL